MRNKYHDYLCSVELQAPHSNQPHTHTHTLILRCAQLWHVQFNVNIIIIIRNVESK